MKTLFLLMHLCALSAADADDVTLENARDKIVIRQVAKEYNELTKIFSATDAVDNYRGCMTRDADSTEHFYILDSDTKKIYEIANIPLPQRFSSDLLFSEPGILNFNRWHSPHYGWHYEIDCRTLKVTEVHAMYDRFFLSGK